MITRRKYDPFTVEKMANFEFIAEIFVFSALFIYIRIMEAHTYKTCTSLGSIYSGVIFVLVGI